MRLSLAVPGFLGSWVRSRVPGFVLGFLGSFSGSCVQFREPGNLGTWERTEEPRNLGTAHDRRWRFLGSLGSWVRSRVPGFVLRSLRSVPRTWEPWNLRTNRGTQEPRNHLGARYALFSTRHRAPGGRTPRGELQFRAAGIAARADPELLSDRAVPPRPRCLHLLGPGPDSSSPPIAPNCRRRLLESPTLSSARNGRPGSRSTTRTFARASPKATKTPS